MIRVYITKTGSFIADDKNRDLKNGKALVTCSVKEGSITTYYTHKIIEPGNHIRLVDDPNHVSFDAAQYKLVERVEFLTQEEYDSVLAQQKSGCLSSGIFKPSLEKAVLCYVNKRANRA